MFGILGSGYYGLLVCIKPYNGSDLLRFVGFAYSQGGHRFVAHYKQTI